MSWQDDVLAAFATGLEDGGYTVTRATNAGYDPATGDPAAGTVSTFSLTDAVVLPSSGRRLAGMLVEGKHTEDAIEITTAVQLRVAGGGFVADRIAFLGETYEIMRVDGPLHLAGGTHYEAVAARLVAP